MIWTRYGIVALRSLCLQRLQKPLEARNAIEPAIAANAVLGLTPILNGVW